jgi:hypothetical protein
MGFVMCEDPIIKRDDYPVLHALMDRMAIAYGYIDWIDAYHALRFGKNVSISLEMIER